jgi:hypothetical protein
MMIGQEESKTSTIKDRQFIATKSMEYKPVVGHYLHKCRCKDNKILHSSDKKDECLSAKQDLFSKIFDDCAKCDELNIKKIAFVYSELTLLSAKSFLHILYFAIKRHKSVNYDTKLKKVKIFFTSKGNGKLNDGDREHWKKLEKKPEIIKWISP